MTIYECYKLLEVPRNSSDEEITKAFYKLAKKFHPDANPDNVDWANKKMASINEAYNKIVEYRKDGTGHFDRNLGDFLKDILKGFRFHKQEEDRKQQEFFKKHGVYNHKENTEYTKTQTQYHQKHTQGHYHQKQSDFPSFEELKGVYERRQEIIQKISKIFKIKRDAVDHGMFMYYQFKLYILPQREHGLGRTKFGDSKRYIKRGLKAIEELHNKCPLPDVRQELALYINFVKNFILAFDCKDYIKSYKNMYEVQAFRYYRSGSEKMNEAFSYLFFKTKAEKNVYQKVNVWPLLMLALQDFIFINEKYSKSNFARDAKIKANLIEQFYKLYEKKIF